MICKCEECNALFFKNEYSRKKNADGKVAYNKCCKDGRVKLAWPFRDYPEDLYNLIVGNDLLSKKLFQAERSINSSFAFGSLSVDHQEKDVMPFAYNIQGQVYHRVNQALHPDPGVQGEYGQLFYIDSEDAVEARLQHKANKKCDRDVMIKIDEILKRVNPYYESFKTMFDVEQEINEKAEAEGREPPSVKLIFDINAKDIDKNRYNLPVRTSEIAAVFVLEEGEEVPMTRGIAVHQFGKKIKILTKWDKRTESMLYPLFFPTGKGRVHKKEFIVKDKCGKDVKIYDNIADRGDGEDQSCTFATYYQYLMARRKPSVLVLNAELEEESSSFGDFDWTRDPEDFEWFNPLVKGKHLYQQWIVDAYVKVEQDKLDFHRNHQEEMKVESYKALHDYYNETADKIGKRVGKIVILPSTFKQGPRQIVQSYQDVMSIVRRFGKPALFITFTCNPRWKEIKRNLHKGNTAIDEPDLVCRVFKMKLDELIDDIVKRQIFGKVVAWNYVVEFQKRGLPHAHILVIFDKDSVIRDADDVDKIISAEIPDENKWPRLHNIVTRHLMHGPCGKFRPNAPCMSKDNNGKSFCAKRFPRILMHIRIWVMIAIRFIAEEKMVYLLKEMELNWIIDLLFRTISFFA